MAVKTPDTAQVRRDTIAITASLKLLSHQLLLSSNSMTEAAENLEENQSATEAH